MDEPTLARLLSQQMIALQQAANLNQQIVQRLGMYDGFDRQPEPWKPAPRGSKPPTIDESPDAHWRVESGLAGRGMHADLREMSVPLLEKDGDDSLSEDLSSTDLNALAPAKFERGVTPTVETLQAGCHNRLQTFLEETAIRRKMSEMLTEHKVEESAFCKDTGFCQWLARNPIFTCISQIIVALNVMWVGVELDLNKAVVLSDAAWPFQVIDNFFCLFFLLEVSVRIEALACKQKILECPWIIFDSILVTTMVYETWIVVFCVQVLGWKPMTGPGGVANSFRVIRIFRIMRMARLVRLLPELLVLMRGMVAGMRSIAAIITMLTLVLYVFALLFTQQDAFSYVLEAMRFLLSQVICGFDSDFLEKMWQSGWTSYTTYICFALVSQFTLMNMLIGIMCQHVADEKDKALEERDLQATGTVFEAIRGTLDPDRTNKFTMNHLQQMKLHPERFAAGLNEQGVDFMAFVKQLQQYVPPDADGIDWVEVKQLMMQCRGSRGITLLDLIQDRQMLVFELSRIQSMLARIPSLR